MAVSIVLGDVGQTDRKRMRKTDRKLYGRVFNALGLRILCPLDILALAVVCDNHLCLRI